MIQFRQIEIFFVPFANRNIKCTVGSKFAFLFLVCVFLMNHAHSQSCDLFDSDEILELTIQGDLKTVFKDCKDDPKYHKVTLCYQDGRDTIAIPVKTKTRGHFRKISYNCKYPPLLLKFSKSSIPEYSVFRDQNKLKLVTPCRNDKYVIREYLVYELYNLITPKSFKVRLVTIIFQDTVKDKTSQPYYGFLIEEEDEMAKRNESFSIKRTGLQPKRTNKDDFLIMAVFQYLIGNTDWSVQFQQNIKLITVDSLRLPTTVPYDFDQAGIVRAPYAQPEPALEMCSTLERRYRGYCIQEMEKFAEVFETFNQLKNDFYSLYNNNPLLSPSYKKQTLDFLDLFYETINDPEKAREAFCYPCDKSGTGHIVIKGIK